MNLTSWLIIFVCILIIGTNLGFISREMNEGLIATTLQSNAADKETFENNANAVKAAAAPSIFDGYEATDELSRVVNIGQLNRRPFLFQQGSDTEAYDTEPYPFRADTSDYAFMTTYEPLNETEVLTR